MSAADAKTPARSAVPWPMLVAVAVIPSAALWLIWSAREPDARLAWLGGLLYWVMPAVLVFVGYTAWRRARARSQPLLEHVQRLWPGALLAVVLAATVCWLVPPEMRVQLDETSLAGVSQNMHQQRAALMTTGSIPFDGAVLPLESTVDKRPPLFAFLVSTVHDVSGYRVANAFYVNAVLLALGLFVAFAAVRARLGVVAGLTAPMLLLAVPLTSVVATSAGFELMASVWLMIALLAALDFVREPDDARFAALLGGGMLFAQSRYESLPAVVLLGALVCWRVRRRFRPSPRSWTLLAICPALLMPLLFLLEHARNPKFTPEAAGQDLLAWAHLSEHIGPLLRGWFDPSPANALPGVVAIVAVFAWGLRVVRRQAGRTDVLVGLPVLALTLAVLAWFYGDVRERTAMRLFLPLAWLTALAPITLVGVFGRRAAIALLVAASALAAWRVHEVAAGAVYPRHRFTVMTEQLDGVVQRLAAEPSKTLWVGVPAQYLVLDGHAALSVRSFLRRAYDIRQLLRRGDLQTIYLIETPFDRAMAAEFGSPSEVMQGFPSEVVERVGGPVPITVRQLGR